MTSSRGSSQPRDRIPVSCIAGRVFTVGSPGKPSGMLLLLLLSRFSCVRLCVTLWTAAHQVPLSVGFSRQEYWSGLPFPPPNGMLLSHKNKITHLPLQETYFDPWVRNIPWRRAWQPTSVFLPGESHGQRNLVGYSPQGRKESDTIEITEH